MSHLKTLLAEHSEWIAPRSDQHTLIGVPNSREHRKTFVEPGGSFSPGVGTFGITTWLYDHSRKQFTAPEELSAESLHWEWEQGYLPILNSRWSAGTVEVTQQLFATSHGTLENIVNTCKITITNRSSVQTDLAFYLVVRPYGPAGGKIRTLSSPASGEVAVNGRVVLLAQKPTAFGAMSYADSQQDISVKLKQGIVPTEQAVKDRGGLCGGVLLYNLSLAPGEQYELLFDCFVHPLEQEYLTAFRHYHQQAYHQKYAAVHTFWEKLLKVVQLRVPDERFSHAYYSILAQLLVATVEHEVRITPVTYPLFWLRDGVYLINALDKAGLHDEVRQQLALIRDRIFVGGFGAEPDAFGEGIWAFLTHFRLTRDNEWLREVYPALQERAEWIIRARTTKEYLYGDVEMRVPANRYAADTDLICEPARDGLIQGRMDWHRPLIWINAFSYFGLIGMVEIAEELGYQESATRYRREAENLQQALYQYARQSFGQNERDTVCAIWPTGAFSPDDALIVEAFEKWWQRVRMQGKDTYKPEPLWKYFELGQAHNYLFLGERAKVWQTVEHYLEQHDVRNLFGWLEDDHDIAEHWHQIEGWYHLPSRQPHGWVSSEFFLLLRDMLAYEDNQRLIIGRGIPVEWLMVDTPVEVLNLPGTFGPLDLRIQRQQNALKLTVCFQIHTHLPESVLISLPWPGRIVSSTIGFFRDNVLVIQRDSYEETGQFDAEIVFTGE